MKMLLFRHKEANQRDHRVSRFQVGAALLLVILTGCSTVPRDEHIEKGLDIYLLIGQSNMAGRTPFDELEDEPSPNILLFNDSDEWEPATHPLNRYSTIRIPEIEQLLGPGYAFAKNMVTEDPDQPIGLVVNARGGTSIRQWQRGSLLFNETVKRTRAAMKQGTLRGVLWLQGGSDKNDTRRYLRRLIAFIAHLRASLDMPNLPFVAGQIKSAPLINEHIAKLPKNVANAGFVSSEGLTTFDYWQVHFDSQSMMLLGKRFAKEMRRVQR